MKTMKRFLQFFLLFMLTLVFVSCRKEIVSTNQPVLETSKEESQAKPVVKEPSELDKFGNIPGNINNGGFAVQAEDSIIYQDADGIYQMDSDGTNVCKLI